MEAEPEETELGRVKRRSRTTMVPLRDASPPANTPEARARSKRGSRKPAKRGCAIGTPPRQARHNKPAEVGRLTDLDTNFLNSEYGGKDAKPKRTSRARKSRKSFEILEDGIAADQDPVASSTLPEGVNEVSQVSGINRTHDAETKSKERTSLGRDSPELRELDFHRISVRPRNGPPKAAEVAERISYPELGCSTLPFSRSSSEDMDASKQQESKTKEITYPTPEASVQDEVEVQAPASDPTDEHVGFDTILESEGFTMIDLESIPSARHFITSPDSAEHPTTENSANNRSPAVPVQSRPVTYPVLAPPSSLKEQPSSIQLSKGIRPPPTPIPSYLAPPEEGEADLSSTVPSSPPIDPIQENPVHRSTLLVPSPLRQAHTPQEATKSSPKLPSPPYQPPKIEKLLTKEDLKQTPPRLGRVVRAGIALQGLLSPKQKTPFLEPSPIPNTTTLANGSACAPLGRLDNIFNGFDSGTRRELRAGLRFGEELAKRQRLSSPSFLDHNAPTKSDPLVQREKVTPPHKSDIPVSQSPSITQEPATPFDANKTVGSIMYLDSEARERRWQSEREAVSRQIENANTSQVIVIDSYIADEATTDKSGTATPQGSPAKSITSEDDEDVWLAEAEKAQNSSRATEEELFPRAEQLRQGERAREAITKPKRRFIPSPWKRGEDVDTTYMTNGDSSGIFWAQPKSRVTSSSLPRPIPNSQRFDVEKMLESSPAKEHEIPAAAECLSVVEKYGKGLEEEQNLSEAQGEILDLENAVENEDVADFEQDQEVDSQNDEDTWEKSSLSPQPVTVPVKFNDTTDISAESDDQVYDNTSLKSSPPTPRHPVTPRSALKGSRASIHLTAETASPTPRKVTFTSLTRSIDEGGIETSMQVRGGSLSPEPLAPSPDTVRKEESTTAAPQQTAPTSWFGKWTSWAVGSASSSSSAVVNPSAPNNKQPAHKDNEWVPTRTTIATSTTNSPTSAGPAKKSYPAPSSTPDPRIPPPPLSLPPSGPFTDHHYKHLHILYLKSLKPSFTRPASVRPNLRSWVGRKCYSGDGEFVWEVSERDGEVLERWCRGFEGKEPADERGNEAGEGEGDRRGFRGKQGRGRYRKLGWSEEELVMRLFSVVVGMEVRREARETGGRKK